MKAFTQKTLTLVVFLALGLLAGCTWGTISEDQLRARYQVLWEDPPVELALEFANELADEFDANLIQLKSLNLHYANCSAEIRDPHSRETWNYWYDGFWLTEAGMSQANDKDPEELLFNIGDVPLDKLNEMIEIGRKEVPFRPASLDLISIQRDDEPPWTLEVTIHYGTVGESHQVVYDGEGQRIR